MRKKIWVIFLALCIFCGTSLASGTFYHETLVTPGYTSAFNTGGVFDHAFSYVTTGVSTNVVLTFQGALDTANYFDITTTTITSNTTTYETKSASPMEWIRFHWASKSGAGTTPNVKVMYQGVR